MNIFQLSCFLAVANSLSFARAAEQMNISQPAITHQIKSLESELNVKLFHRSTRLVEITPEGQSFITDAKNIVAIAGQAKVRFSNPKEYPVETLSIGCNSYTQLALLTEVLHELLLQHPNVHPQLHVVPHEQLFRLLETETANAVLGMREGADIEAGLFFQELQNRSLVCACREAYFPDSCEKITMQELEGKKLIFCNPIAIDPEISRLQWKLAEGKAPADIHFCESVEAAIVLAEAGFGLAILPEVMLPANHQLKTVALADSPRLSFGIYYKPFPGDALLKHFIQIAKHCFQSSCKEVQAAHQQAAEVPYNPV